jgi:hypothetical protein
MRKSSHATADRSAHHVLDSRARRRAGRAQRRLLRDEPLNSAAFISHASTNERRGPMRQLSITPNITVHPRLSRVLAAAVRLNRK